MKTSKFLLALTLIIIISLTALIGFFPPNGDFRVDNPSWNGLSTLDSKMKATPIDSFSALPSDPNGTALLLVPYEPFSASELSELKSYALNGGTLVVLDDYGYGNQVLSGTGLSMRFSGVPMLDPVFNYKNEWLPKITNFASSPVAANVSSLVLNHATCLDNTSGATVVAFSSSFSFLDIKGSGTWDSSDPSGPFPYAAYEKVGQGYVVAVADPSIMINSMIGMGDNLQFINNVVKLSGPGAQVFVDQEHLPTGPLDTAKADLAVVYAAVSSTFGTLTLIAVILVLSLNSIWRKGERRAGKH
jgi:hypothetical protein